MADAEQIIQFPDGMLVGFELEFCAALRIDTTDFYDKFGHVYGIGTDNSLNPQQADAAHCLEVRSIARADVSVSTLRELLQYVKRHAAFTTRCCGFHVHMSWTVVEALDLFKALLVNIVPKVKPFAEREDYCHPKFNSTRGGRYSALRWVEIADGRGHFEIRIFNGTLKLRGIAHWLNQIRNEALQLAGDVSQATMTQSAGCVSRDTASVNSGTST